MTDIRTYLLSRIERADYRGEHLAQHNRLPFEKAAALLSAIFAEAGEGVFPIPRGDDSGARVRGFRKFYRMADRAKKNLGQGTVNSLKKNHFPDFARMGFLDRFDKDDAVLPFKSRRSIFRAKLTANALALIRAKNPREKYRLYLAGVERLIGERMLDEIFAILFEDKFESVSVHEFMFVLSDPSVLRAEKKKLLKSFRRMSALERTKLRADARAKCEEISRRAVNRSGKRDFGNWHNQALQSLNLLNQTVYFKTFKKTVLMLGFSNEALEFLAKRGAEARRRAIEWHRIDRREGYDLHHIVPLDVAYNRGTLKMIDDPRNLLYLSRPAHRQIPTRNNLFVRLSVEESAGQKTIRLVDPFSDDAIDVSGEVVCCEANLSEMVKYNKRLLNSVAQ